MVISDYVRNYEENVTGCCGRDMGGATQDGEERGTLRKEKIFCDLSDKREPSALLGEKKTFHPQSRSR